MNSRERVLAVLNHEETDRVPICDSVWKATIERWYKEGLPANSCPEEYFDYEIVGFGADTSPRFPVETIEENDEYIVATTPYGGVRRNHKNYSTTPEIISYPCKSREDWEKIKERLVPSPDRFSTGNEWLFGIGGAEFAEGVILENSLTGLERYRKARKDGKFICYNAIVGYDKIQQYVATEQLLITIATDPEWIRDMYETDAKMVIGMYELMKKAGFEFDAAWLMCDLGYRNGLLFSPHHFEEQLRPTFQLFFDYFKGEGMPVILHSCGDIRKLIPYFIEDGLTCLQPLEVKAGMDLVELKKNFGDKLAFMGGIDVRAMADPDPSIIENEIKTKISIAKKGGGYIYHSDHSVPNNVSFERYCRVIELVKEYGCYTRKI